MKYSKSTMRTISLTKGQVAIIDDEDYEKVAKNKWSFHYNGYAVRGKPQISMHRFVLDAPRGMEVDHINGNKLDNRKSNLRFATRKQNSFNIRHEDGISWRPNREAWIVRMKTLDGRRVYVGYFKDKEEALEARRMASLRYHGEFSPYALSS